jgi:hypothetical protein
MNQRDTAEQARIRKQGFATITILFYIVFVVIQTVRHRAFFAEPEGNGNRAAYDNRRPHKHATGPLGYHVIMLLLTLLPVVLLSKFFAIIVDLGIEELGAPAPLGGILIAVLVLSPEALRTSHRTRGASWARSSRCRAADPDAVRQRAQLWRRAHQRAPRHRAPALVRGLHRADLQPVIPSPLWGEGRAAFRGHDKGEAGQIA